MKIKLSISNYQFPTIKTGFTMIELMAVVAIIMILTAIMIPAVSTHIERGKEGRAYADIDILVKAINLYYIDHGALPENLTNLLGESDGYGPYISDAAIAESPWGGPYSYDKEGDNSYTISATSSKTGKVISKTITL